MNKYKLKNITCASCAGRIENELEKLPGVKAVNLNFAALTLNIDYDNINELRKIVKKIEPGGDIEKHTAGDISQAGNKSKIKKELSIILLVVVLLITGIVFRDELAGTPYSIAEYIVFLSAWLLSGWGVLSKAVKNIIHGKVFDENFLMTIATLGAVIIGELPEAAAVMLFYNVGEFVQGLAVNNSRRSIKALLEIRPDYANLKKDNKIKKVKPEDVAKGDIIIIKAGEKIPLDGVVIEGSSFVDTFALTGESVPRSIKTNDTILSGMINKTGLLTVKVINDFSESTVSKILELVESAGKKKAETEKFITTFARYYTPVVVFTALAIAVVPPLILSGHTFEEWIYRALVILVISCPCALVVSIPLGYFGGIGGASKRGILVKGSNYLDALTKIKKVVFDKTGTLTKGVFKVTSVVSLNGLPEREILYYAAMAESHSNHPAAKSILEAYPGVDPALVKNYKEISGQGIVAEINGKQIIAGNDRLLHTENVYHENCVVEGTVVHVAIDKKYAGYIVISDELREESVNTIKELKENGVEEIIMLTGDNEYSARIMADKLGIDKYYAELLPQDKVEYLEKIMAGYPVNVISTESSREKSFSSYKGKDFSVADSLGMTNKKKKDGKVAFVGDGINDAPVIARADVGIAMGGLGSDAAVEAADVVIMEDNPSKVVEAIIVAKKTRRIVWQNIIFAMGIKTFFIALGGLGIASMWEAVFADMGVALIAIFNSTRMLRK
ncbi:MAG: heavy metal translocating P-type ATPase [Ignavibacteriaceae bacterium]